MEQVAPLLMLLGALLLFWLLILRPARRQQNAMQTLQESLKVGDEVVIGAGIFGRITSLNERSAQLEIAPGTAITVARQVVVKKVDPADDPRRDQPAESAPAPAETNDEES